jgi:hypothetical protein
MNISARHKTNNHLGEYRVPTCVAALGGVEVGHLLLQLRAASIRIGHTHHHHSPTKAITERRRKM